MRETKSLIPPSSQSSAGRFLALFALVFVLLVLRRPDTITNPQFWAEDALIFFFGQITTPGLGILFQPYSGYLHMAPRLVTAFAVLFHASSVPLVMNLCALIIAALCCSLFSLNRYRYLLQSDWLRIALCLVITTAFQAVEFIGNITCVHCFLFIGALLVALQPAEAYGGKHAWSAYLAVAGGLLSGLSDPGVLLLLPLCVWLAIKHKGIASLAPGVVALAALVQISFFLREPSHAATESMGQILAASTATITYRVAVASMLGVQTAKSLSAENSTPMLLVTVIALTAWLTSLWWHNNTERRWRMAIGAYLVIASVGLAIGGRSLAGAFYHPDGGISWQAERYFFAGACLFAYLVALSLESWMPKRKLAQVFALAVLFATGAWRNFYIKPTFLTDYRWEEYAPMVDRWLSDRRAGRTPVALSIPINPTPWKLELPGVKKPIE
jgi:hypothetical protein